MFVTFVECLCLCLGGCLLDLVVWVLWFTCVWLCLVVDLLFCDLLFNAFCLGLGCYLLCCISVTVCLLFVGALMCLV